MKGQMLRFASELNPFRINSSNYTGPVYDGLTFPPNLFDKPVIDIFNSDFCRPIRIQFDGTVNMFGIKEMHRYVVKLIDFEQCTNASDPTTCPEVDKLDVSRCISASLPANTIFLSKAHFYGSKNETMEEMNVDGFRPTRDKHDSFIYFEPYSGTPFEAVFRIQLNVGALIDPMRVSDDGSELEWTGRRSTRRLLPVLWIEQKINLSEDVMERLRRALSLRDKCAWVIIPIGIGLAILFIVTMELLARRSSKKYKHLPSYTVDQRASR